MKIKFPNYLLEPSFDLNQYIENITTALEQEIYEYFELKKSFSTVQSQNEFLNILKSQKILLKKLYLFSILLKYREEEFHLNFEQETNIADEIAYICEEVRGTLVAKGDWMIPSSIMVNNQFPYYTLQNILGYSYLSEEEDRMVEEYYANFKESEHNVYFNGNLPVMQGDTIMYKEDLCKENKIKFLHKKSRKTKKIKLKNKLVEEMNLLLKIAAIKLIEHTYRVQNGILYLFLKFNYKLSVANKIDEIKFHIIEISHKGTIDSRNSRLISRNECNQYTDYLSSITADELIEFDKKYFYDYAYAKILFFYAEHECKFLCIKKYDTFFSLKILNEFCIKIDKICIEKTFENFYRFFKREIAVEDMSHILSHTENNEYVEFTNSTNEILFFPKSIERFISRKIRTTFLLQYGILHYTDCHTYSDYINVSTQETSPNLPYDNLHTKKYFFEERECNFFKIRKYNFKTKIAEKNNFFVASENSYVLVCREYLCIGKFKNKIQTVRKICIKNDIMHDLYFDYAKNNFTISMDRIEKFFPCLLIIPLFENRFLKNIFLDGGNLKFTYDNFSVEISPEFFSADQLATYEFLIEGEKITDIKKYLLYRKIQADVEEENIIWKNIILNKNQIKNDFKQIYEIENIDEEYIKHFDYGDKFMRINLTDKNILYVSPHKIFSPNYLINMMVDNLSIEIDILKYFTSLNMMIESNLIPDVLLNSMFLFNFNETFKFFIDLSTYEVVELNKKKKITNLFLNFIQKEKQKSIYRKILCEFGSFDELNLPKKNPGCLFNSKKIITEFKSFEIFLLKKNNFLIKIENEEDEFANNLLNRIGDFKSLIFYLRTGLIKKI